MSLQVRARLGATLHLFAHLFNKPTDHAIWRITRWWGFDTQRVFCECGAEFTKPPQGATTVEQYLEDIKTYRALATIQLMDSMRKKKP